MTWFVEVETDMGWVTAPRSFVASTLSNLGKSHEASMQIFEEMLLKLNRAENENIDLDFFAVRIEYRR